MRYRYTSRIRICVRRRHRHIDWMPLWAISCVYSIWIGFCWSYDGHVNWRTANQHKLPQTQTHMFHFAQAQTHSAHIAAPMTTTVANETNTFPTEKRKIRDENIINNFWIGKANAEIPTHGLCIHYNVQWNAHTHSLLAHQINFMRSRMLLVAAHSARYVYK